MGFLGHEILRAVTFSDRKTWYARTRWRKWVEACAIADHVAEVQTVVGRKVVVHAQSTLIGVVSLGFCRSESIESAVR